MDLMAEKLRDVPIVFLDLETTGLSPEAGHEILEIGAVRTKGGEERGYLESLVRPSKPIPPESSKIHGITDLFVMGAPTVDMVLNDLLTFIGDAVVIAHNAPFDLGFVSLALEAISTKLPNNPVIDTVLLSRRLHPGSPSHKLDTLKKTYGVTAERAHRALDDTRALAKVFAKMVEAHFPAINGGPTLADVAAKAAPVYIFSDFAGGLPVKGSEMRGLLRWALREKEALVASVLPSGRLTPVEYVIVPTSLKGTPPALKGTQPRKNDEELVIKFSELTQLRRAG